MKTLYGAEAISQGGRSGTIQMPDQLLNVTLENPWKKGGMNQASGKVDRLKVGLGVALLAALTGCVGYVDGGYYGGSAVVVPGPDVYFYGGGYERGHDVRVYSHRGVESRAVAHPSRAPSPHSVSGGHGGKR